MTITSEGLRHCAEMASITSEGVSCLSAEQLTQIADHLDAQEARIAELENEVLRLNSGSKPFVVRLPDGWTLVPIEPSLAMLTMLGLTGSFESMVQKYHAMLEAAPEPEVP